MPLRAGDDALKGTWIDFEICRNGERTYHNSFFTSLEVTADTGLFSCLNSGWQTVVARGCASLSARHGDPGFPSLRPARAGHFVLDLSAWVGWSRC